MKKITSYAQLKKVYPMISVKGIDLKTAIEEQKGHRDNAKFFVAHLSLNRYLVRPLLQFTQAEKIDLLKTLFDKGFFLQPAMFPSFQPSIPTDFGLDIFRGIVKAQGHTEETSIGKCLLLNQILEKRNLEEEPLKNYYDFFQSTTVEFLETNFNRFTLGSTFQMFTLADGLMQVGDQPYLQSLISANKALLARDLAKLNIKKLEKGETKLYDIRYLF